MRQYQTKAGNIMGKFLTALADHAAAVVGAFTAAVIIVSLIIGHQHAARVWDDSCNAQGGIVVHDMCIVDGIIIIATR